MNEFYPVLISILVGFFLVGTALGLSSLMGPKRKTSSIKETPFECGNRPFEEPGRQHPIHFYTVAILFLVFDIEVIFLYPWVASFGVVGKVGFFGALFFIAVLTFGLIYEWIRGGLEWH